jgi:hypothetical protein
MMRMMIRINVHEGAISKTIFAESRRGQQLSAKKLVQVPE